MSMTNLARAFAKIAAGDTFTAPDFSLADYCSADISLTVWVYAEDVTGRDRKGPERSVIPDGSRVRVVGVSDEFGALCVMLDNGDRAGTAVRNGQHFFMDPKQLAQWESVRKEMAVMRWRRIAEAKRLMRGE